ncbi:type II secretion system F family protein [Phascolarctobacterium succinatutens]|uniref:type II secretion system F family protein n=1 Tax=Phascolarctobacterium succinatutens TaxID=626940 RepID=UPI004025A374
MKIKLRGGVSLAEQISFYRQLAVILRSGLPLLNALQLLQKHGSAKQMLLCYRLQQRLRRGSSLAQALAAEADCCTQLAVTLVAVGEESGELAMLLEQLADYYSRQLKLRRFVQRAVTYPAFLLLASFCVLLLFLLYILPVLADTYSAMGVLPMGTLALLLTLKDALLQQPLAALALTAGVAAALFLLGRRLLRCFLRSRLSGNFHGLLLEVRFCRLLALLLESGVGITKAVAIVTDTMDDEQYAGQLRLLNSRLKRGIAIEQAAAGGAKELFSPLMLELVCVGASTGYLPQMLQEAVTAGEQRLQQQLGRLQELLVPLLLLVAAIIIAGIVCIVIGPLFEMLSAMPE